MMRCFSCVSRRVSPGSTGKSATVTSPTPNRAIEQRDVACDAELPTARQLSDSREETAKDRNVPLINRVARVPHERQTDGGFGANAAHHGDPLPPLDATLNEPWSHVSHMAVARLGKQSGESLHVHQGNPSKVTGASPRGRRPCCCGSELRADETTADGVTDQARRVVDIELRHDPGPVILRGLDAYAPEPSDLFRCLSLHHQLKQKWVRPKVKP